MLIHGIGTSLACWDPLVPLLAKDYRVTVLDVPGFGLSQGVADRLALGLDDQVPRILALMDALAIAQAYVVGSSMGGNLALWLALTAPKRVQGLAVIAPATDPRLIPFWFQWTRLLWHESAWLWSNLLNPWLVHWTHRRTLAKLAHTVNASKVDESLRTYFNQPKAIRSFIRATRAIDDRRLPKDLSALDLNVLVLWGGRDRVVSRKSIKKLTQTLPNCKFVENTEGGHHLQEDDPHWVCEQLRMHFPTYVARPRA